MSTATEIAAAEAAFHLNASYIADLDVAKCRKFITACTQLLLAPSSMTKGANSISSRPDLIEKRLDRAERWLEIHSPNQIPGPRVTKSSFRGFRRGGL